MDVQTFVNTCVFPILEKGDLSWDKPHAEATAYHMGQVLTQNPQLQLDEDVMLLTAYMHDIGYSPFYKPGQSLTKDEYMQAKREHMDRGVEIAEKLLASVDLKAEEKERILHLISVHDKLDQLKDIDELVLMEADTLAGLDVNFVKPSFTKEENNEHMRQVREKRLPLFTTEYGKKAFEELLELRNQYYESH